MTRIVGGVARSRRLAVPPGHGTRPSADRTREGLFSSLGTLLTVEGARVLDLYAGSGAVGLEALSRGAALAVLVDSDERALSALRANARVLGLPGAQVVRSSVERWLTSYDARGPFDVVFADPPYDVSDATVARVLTAVVDGRWLAPDAVVVVERASRAGPLTWPVGLEPVRERRYGEATLWYGRASPGGAGKERPCAERSAPAPSTP